MIVHADEVVLELLKRRIDDADVAMRRALNESMYADRPDYQRPRVTLRQRWRLAKERVHDAWLVLTGRAEIG